MEELLPQALLGYLRRTHQDGVRAYSTAPRVRQESKVHASALGAMGQLYNQVWKDVHAGMVLVGLKGRREIWGGVLSSPFGAVDKLLPDRTVAPDKRIVHDKKFSGLNGTCEPGWHPLLCSPSTGKSRGESSGGRRATPGYRCC